MRRGRLGQNGRPRNGRTVPSLWLLSDARRLPDPRAAAARLPRGAAVLARDLAPGLLRPLAALARRRGLMLVVAGDGRAALALRAGLHLPDRRAVRGLLPFLAARRAGAAGPLSVAAHGRAGIARARRLRADLVILSPVFPTASHPGAPALGPLRWAALARRAGRPVVALGGVNGKNSRRLPRPAAGWAAIGGLA
ncbi:thiamine phosphate synthase [Pararoseomonas sp. SCSIO 73927]|uniref:thiamine phosphate synthase n=1 Tax=Pararoseomonas sp. SCSIO 73927 TaxID=3114537 RepID=UPI0030CF2A25